MINQTWIRSIGRIVIGIGIVLLLNHLDGRIGLNGQIGGQTAGATTSPRHPAAGMDDRISQRSQPPSPAAVRSEMQQDYIDELAARTTVVIAQDLQPGDVETGQAFKPGSGAIVAKTGNLYFVVTNLHVVPLVNVTYGIRTFDGKIHTVRPSDRAFGIYRFGEQMGETVSGMDLAVIPFESDEDYPVAGMDLSNPPTRGDAAFVSGWPQSPEGQPMQRRFSPGQVANVAPPSSDGGYGLFYTSATALGMSGGPVFNQQGEVMGIHGRGFTTQTEGTNQGIEANQVADRAAELKRAGALLSRFDFVPRSPNSATIAGWLRDRPATADVFNNPAAAFREAFRAAALKDCSSSRVDTGDPEDQCS